MLSFARFKSYLFTNTSRQDNANTKHLEVDKLSPFMQDRTTCQFRKTYSQQTLTPTILFNHAWQKRLELIKDKKIEKKVNMG